jgi:hypothetical protein
LYQLPLTHSLSVFAVGLETTKGGASGRALLYHLDGVPRTFFFFNGGAE